MKRIFFVLMFLIIFSVQRIFSEEIEINGASLVLKTDKGNKVSIYPIYTEIRNNTSTHFYYIELSKTKPVKTALSVLDIKSPKKNIIKSITAYSISNITQFTEIFNETECFTIIKKIKKNITIQVPGILPNETKNETITIEEDAPEQTCQQIERQINKTKFVFSPISLMDNTKNDKFLIAVSTQPFVSFSWNYTNPSLSFDPTISCGGIITTPGEYFMTENCSISNNHGLQIYSENVTLDCQGYWFIGANTSSFYGILAGLYKNITIKNCNIDNFITGIYFSSNGSIINVFANASYYPSSGVYGRGIYTTSKNLTLENSTLISQHRPLYCSSCNAVTKNNKFLTAFSYSVGATFQFSASLYSENDTYTGGGSEAAMVIDSTSNARFVKPNMLISGVGNGILISSTSQNVSIDCLNNTILGTGDYKGIYALSKNTNISNCNISNFKRAIDITNAENTTIENLTLFGNGSLGDGYGLYMYNCKNCKIKNITSASVRSSIAYGIGSVFLYGENITAENIISNGTNTAGLFISASKNVEVKNSNLYAYGYAPLYITGTGEGTKNITISNVTGIQTLNVVGAYPALNLYSNVEGVKVSNSYFEGGGGRAISTVLNVTEINISNVKLKEILNINLVFVAASTLPANKPLVNITIDCSGNVVNSTSTKIFYEFQIRAPGVKILNCPILNSSYGILADASNIDVENVTFSGNNDNRFFSTTGYENITLKNLNISKTGYIAYLENAKNITIENVFADKTNTTIDPAVFFNSTNNSLIKNLTIINSPSNAIYFEKSTQNRIENANLSTSSTGETVLFINSQNNQIENTTITASNSVALRLSAATANNITNSYLYSSISNSIHFLSSSNSNIFENNTLQTTFSSANVYIQSGTSNVFIKNKIIGGTTGVYAITSSSGNVFVLNNFTSSSVFVEDNTNSNFYNTTYEGKNQGNIYENVINFDVTIWGFTNSSIPGFYIGENKKYNSTTSKGKMIGAEDGAPLTPLNNIPYPNNFSFVKPNAWNVTYYPYNSGVYFEHTDCVSPINKPLNRTITLYNNNSVFLRNILEEATYSSNSTTATINETDLLFYVIGICCDFENELCTNSSKSVVFGVYNTSLFADFSPYARPDGVSLKTNMFAEFCNYSVFPIFTFKNAGATLNHIDMTQYMVNYTTNVSDASKVLFYGIASDTYIRQCFVSNIYNETAKSTTREIEILGRQLSAEEQTMIVSAPNNIGFVFGAIIIVLVLAAYFYFVYLRGDRQ